MEENQWRSMMECENDIDTLMLIEDEITGAIKEDNLIRLGEMLIKLDSLDLSSQYSTCSTSSDQILSKALVLAANKGRKEAMELLLDNGGQRVIDLHNEYGNTPLIMAAIRSDGDIMSLLLKYGCSVNIKDDEARSALHWTAMKGDDDIVDELLRNGCAPDDPDSIYGFTPLMQAARQGHTKIVESLLQFDCDVNRVDMHRETPLFDAVRNNNVQCISLLLDAGADINHCDRRGRAPVHVAVLYRRTKALQMLISENCQLDIHNTDASWNHLGERYTALELAVLECEEDSCNLLVQAGANVQNLHHFSNMRTDSTFPSGGSVNEWVNDIISKQPVTLKELTRNCIRKFYGKSFTNIVHNLPIPNALKMYLEIPEIKCESLGQTS